MTEADQQTDSRAADTICWQSDEPTESKWTRCNGPRTRYRWVVGVTTPKRSMTSRFGRLRAFMRLFPVLAFIGASSSLMAFDENIWREFACGDIDLVKKMLLCEQDFDIEDLAVRQLIAAYMFYKEGNLHASWCCFEGLDTLLHEYFVRRQIDLQGTAPESQ